MRKSVTIVPLVNRCLRWLGRHARIVKHRVRILMRRVRRRSLFCAAERSVERDHRRLWSALCWPVDVSWLRLYSTVSLCQDARYVPEDIYYAILERRLNDANYADYAGDKNYYERHLDPGLFPRVFLRKMSGVFLDGDYGYLSWTAAQTRFDALREPAIVKPATGSYGGRDVLLLALEQGGNGPDAAVRLDLASIDQRYRDNYVVQEAIRQHAVLAAFHPASVNTLRLFTYRSVSDNRVHVLRCVLRMGRSGRVVDNQAAGGLSCLVDLNSGELNAYAVNKEVEKCTVHPDTSFPFAGTVVPEIEAAVRCVRNVAGQIVSQRLLSFDVAVTADGQIKLIEINTLGMELNFLQYAGGPLLGDFTAEVIEYCRAHPDRDNLRLLRL
jgi:hypothetical protein